MFGWQLWRPQHTIVLSTFLAVHQLARIICNSLLGLLVRVSLCRLQVRLMIIDEIHLLHDSRGPVLESIVARTIRQARPIASIVPLFCTASSSLSTPLQA